MEFWNRLPLTLMLGMALAIQVLGSALLAIPQEQPYRNGTSLLRLRDAVGCPAGLISCPIFGCVQAATCPQDCASRKNSTSCAISINGKGCSWVEETCVHNIQCSITASGQCSEGCKGCGEFQCVNAGLQCPRSCASRSFGECNTLALANGVGCAWDGAKCIPWDPVNNKPIPPTLPMASQSAPPPASSATAPQPPTTSQASPNPPTSVASLSTTAQFNTSTSQQTSATASPSSSSSEESALSANSLLPTQETSDQGSPSSAPPNSLLGSNNGNSGESKRSSGLGIGTIIAIVVGVLAAIGLISWVVLYQATKSKVNFQAPIHSGDLEKSSNMHYSGPMVNDNSAAIRDAYGSQVDLITTAARVAGVPQR